MSWSKNWNRSKGRNRNWKGNWNRRSKRSRGMIYRWWRSRSYKNRRSWKM